MIIPLEALRVVVWELVGAITVALVIIYWPASRKKRGPWDRK
jgi:hypothetical protein